MRAALVSPVTMTVHVRNTGMSTKPNALGDTPPLQRADKQFSIPAQVTWARVGTPSGEASAVPRAASALVLKSDIARAGFALWEPTRQAKVIVSGTELYIESFRPAFERTARATDLTPGQFDGYFLNLVGGSAERK